MTVSGRVCLVTGASSGIGNRVALDLAAAGATVCITARRTDRLQELLGGLGGRGDHSLFTADVGDRNSVRALAGHVSDTYGRCDVLINNAGFMEDGPFRGPDDVDQLERVMQTNFWGTVYCTAELLPLLLDSAPSSVVNVASMAGRLAVGASSYCASKFAVVGWSEALQSDLAERGVYVSLVEPGFIPTEGFPQQDLVTDPFLKYALGTTEQVSAAIFDAIENRKVERVVPRWYYLLQVPRVLAPGLYRWVLRKAVEPRQKKRLSA